MEERARKGELVDDVSDTGSHEQIERVVVSKLQHPPTSGSRKEAYPVGQTLQAWSARLPSHLLKVLPTYFIASSPRISTPLDVVITQSPHYLCQTRPNGPLKEILHAQEVARPPTLFGHDHRAFLFIYHVLHFERRNADVSYSTTADGRARPSADSPARYHAAGARWAVPSARSLYGSIDTCRASQPGGFRPCGRLQACHKPQARSHDLSLILARVFCALLTSIT
jgi:hypothetical protein